MGMGIHMGIPIPTATLFQVHKIPSTNTVILTVTYTSQLGIDRGQNLAGAGAGAGLKYYWPGPRPGPGLELMVNSASLQLFLC